MFNPLNNFAQAWAALSNKLEKYMVLITLGSFGLGIYLASVFISFADFINSMMDGFIDGYGFIAPLIIFIILAPTLSRVFSSKESGKFGMYVIEWLAVKKLMACVFGAVITAIIFGFAIFPDSSVSIVNALLTALKSLGSMMLTSPYFYAVYASIIVSLIAIKIKILSNGLRHIVRGVESIGQYFELFIPFFMLAIGAYVYALPRNIAEQTEGAAGAVLHNVQIFGFINIDPTTASGMIWTYIAGALLVGLACFIWHFALLIYTKLKVKRFSIKEYFTKYWIKVYPLLWATSSEALATPLNLYLTKKHAPWVDKTVRRLAVGMGSFMNINGTIICVFVLAGLVLVMLGINISLLELLLAVPIVFLISYGVPGIPGELVLFAGPMALLLGLPVEILPIFLALYIGLQIGLPDSFRTGNNSTDNFVVAILLNETYEKKYKLKDDQEASEEIVGDEDEK